MFLLGITVAILQVKKATIHKNTVNVNFFDRKSFSLISFGVGQAKFLAQLVVESHFIACRSTWGECSTSCPGGTQRRSRRHSCTNQVEEEFAPCPPRDPVYSDWTDYGSCSSTCRGRRVRQQFEACGGPPIQETEGCGTDGKFLSFLTY